MDNWFKWALPLKKYIFFPPQQEVKEDRVRTGVIRSMGKESTALSNAFFHQRNIEYLQHEIVVRYRNESGLTVSRQSDEALLAIMRVHYINNHGQPLNFLNTLVLEDSLRQVRNGVSSHVRYIRDLDAPLRVMDRPANVSDYGKKI